MLGRTFRRWRISRVSRHAFAVPKAAPLVATVALMALLSSCASAPIAPPPLGPVRPDELGAAGVALYDSADVFSPVAGAQAWGMGRIGPLDLGGHLQLSFGEGLRPRFLGGGVQAQLRLHMDESWFLGGAFSAEYVDAFAYWRDTRSRLLLVTFGLPASVELFENASVWVRPAIGGAAPAWLFHNDLGLRPSFGVPLPVFRLTYGASYDFGWVQVYGASSTTLPFGGAFLAFGLAVAI